ncbi:histidinol dehydrogenase [Rhodoferax sp. 4810]|uniref:Histidinol dehydrogenase n=1 Tax=Thiospirillum jenense TaxID=1653858 RepID=A0A839H3I2_9GAMM|nr:histidinol dehydrogenase [Thiospirillum jenense]MBB1076280.1 histidinol dehydrogenase [Rhodoferax jenense]MBB1124873.1 histidinol dehydrogenase [Thiospirillum jenense]
MFELTRLTTAAADFTQRLDQLLAWESVADARVQQVVDTIIADVRCNGDVALCDYTARFDGWTPENAAALELPQSRWTAALAAIPADQRTALETAAARIRAYAEHQRLASWAYTDTDGTLLGQQVTPLDRVGLYVPGGKAAYPSSVLMNAIPAKVAGVAELIMVVPTPNGEVNSLVLAAAAIAGIDRAFAIGGAQAIAALAYGTERVPAVDKIVGPGNSYVATAKRAVFGQVGIDMIAGPSEILIICDGQTNPDWIAMDLFSQAEHDEDAQALLIAWDDNYLDQVAASIERLLPQMERRSIIEPALQRRGGFILARDLDEAISIANHIAAEHLELSVDNPQAVAARIRHAGAIFMGRHTPEALGDYCAGANHVLPTSRTARFSSPLGVYDFQKRSSLIMASPNSAAQLAPIASVLARGEGLTAHAQSAEYRG